MIGVLHRALKGKPVPKPEKPDKRAFEAELDAMRPRVAWRSGGICEAHLPGCKRIATVVHHRKRRSQGGTNDIANLMHLCAGPWGDGCHEKIHRNPMLSFTCGFLVRSTEDPIEVPILVGLDLWDGPK